MKKKRYILPQALVLVFPTESLLAGISNNTDTDEDDDTELGAKRHVVVDNAPSWDDEEETAPATIPHLKGVWE